MNASPEIRAICYIQNIFHCFAYYLNDSQRDITSYILSLGETSAKDELERRDNLFKVTNFRLALYQFVVDQGLPGLRENFEKIMGQPILEQGKEGEPQVVAFVPKEGRAESLENTKGQLQAFYQNFILPLKQMKPDHMNAQLYDYFEDEGGMEMYIKRAAAGARLLPITNPEGWFWHYKYSDKTKTHFADMQQEIIGFEKLIGIEPEKGSKGRKQT